jgi:phosphoglycerol transferase MdoB-like AlkP superfamily enzyme
MARSAVVRRSTAGLLFLLAIATTVALFFIPAWFIQPFKPQTGRMIDVSYAIKRVSPLLTIVTLAAALWFASRVWPAARWWTRTALVLAVAVAGLATWLARKNYFEWGFNPLPHATYASMTQASFVDAKDMVLGVTVNGESVAYPIRQLAYHHVVQDVVGGIPIVVTY